MDMHNKLTGKLVSILQNNLLSVRDTLTVCRRLAREFQLTHSNGRHYYSDAIELAEAGLPFTKDRVQLLKESDKEFHHAYEKQLLSIGNWLVDAGPCLDQEFSFDEICDLLNVNPVHRQEVRSGSRDNSDALISVVHFAGLEDSAEQLSGRKKREYKDGPLFWCYMEVMCEFIKKTQGHSLVQCLNQEARCMAYPYID